jgi:hypothetical protein
MDQKTRVDSNQPLTRLLLAIVGSGFLLAAFSSGCSISIPQNKLPTPVELPDRFAMTARPSAFLDVKFLADLSGGERPAFEHPPATAKFRELVDKVTRESGLFVRYTFEAEEQDYGIKMHMLNYGSAGAAVAAGFLSGATLGIIPGEVTDNYRLTVKVTDRNGQELKTYEFEDAVDTWIGIWFPPGVGSQTEEVVPALFENMLKHAYRAICDDKLLER